jgi:hypothetical protein
VYWSGKQAQTSSSLSILYRADLSLHRHPPIDFIRSTLVSFISLFSFTSKRPAVCLLC